MTTPASSCTIPKAGPSAAREDEAERLLNAPIREPLMALGIREALAQIPEDEIPQMHVHARAVIRIIREYADELDPPPLQEEQKP